ncbi:MAG: PEP-CTERM sorting domain-containing protein [Akkermansia sp.]|nr:PEP-CTERM sorting domain-containing protein [Akkermansia sp.]
MSGAMYGSEKVDGDVTINISGGTINNVYGTNAGSVTGDVNIYLTGGSVSTYIYGGDANNIGGTRTLYVGTEEKSIDASTYYVYGFDSIVVAEGSSLTTTGGLDYSQVTEFSFTLSDANLTEASINTDGWVYMCYNSITLNLSALGSLEDGRYILIDAANVYAPYWNADYVTLNTEGVNATFDDLKWENNQLVLYVESENVPEPTTATLSLLALAGLAARRRRK